MQQGHTQKAKPVLFQSVNRRDPIEDELFEDEKKVLSEFKENNEELCSHFSDRFIMAALFSRKLNQNRAKIMLEKNWAWRVENGYEEIPALHDTQHEYFFKKCGINTVPGARSKDGLNYILFLKVSEWHPSEFSINEMVKFCLWFYGYAIEHERMDAYRNGIIMVEDCTDAGWNNFDLQTQKILAKVFMEKFPLRYRKIVMVNFPSILKPILTICKVFMPTKLMERIVAVQPEGLWEYLDPEATPKEYGGKLDWSYEECYSHFIEWERSYGYEKKGDLKQENSGQKESLDQLD